MLLEFKNIHGCYYILIVYYFDDILKIFSLMLSYYIFMYYKPINLFTFHTIQRLVGIYSKVKSKKLISLINNTDIIYNTSI